jgi:hypothetical protein
MTPEWAPSGELALNNANPKRHLSVSTDKFRIDLGNLPKLPAKQLSYSSAASARFRRNPPFDRVVDGVEFETAHGVYFDHLQGQSERRL